MNKVSYIFTTVFYSSKQERIHFAIKTLFFLAYTAVIVSACICLHRLQEKPVPVSTPKQTKIVKSEPRWTVSQHDSIELSKLVPILIKREGLRLSPYKLDGHWYLGYGSLLEDADLVDEQELLSIKIDSAKALRMLYQDIQEAYIEYSRIHTKKMAKEVYNIFISGKPILKRKEIK